MEQNLRSLNSSEEWRPVEGFPHYEVSNLGKVRNSRTGRILKNSNDGKGYIRIGLSVNGKETKKRVHRLVAEAFIPNPENKPMVNHISGLKSDNNVINLEWCTNAENIKHAYDNELINKEALQGEKHGGSKLSENDVNSIRKRYKNGEGSRSLANYFNISQSTICDIVKYRSWKHIL